ncbi:MAG: aldehyde dehydrogenase family protein [Flavobacteriales bacterium]|nr:aldehyde dehydrogenase family protein [Flavobacteriales bacterium]NNK81252.1 aldehyde dehydrogenase family protein [Flavobacteriales bacterium]
MERLEVLKTYKIYIGGKFPRTESGRFYTPSVEGRQLGNICLSSRKDFRNAMVAARAAQPAWAERSAFNRGQILYRIAEMLESRRAQFIEEIVIQGNTKREAKKELEQSIDRLVYYAGWCDKYQQIFSSVNPVASSHFNFSILEPTGVVFLYANEESPLLGLISLIAPIIAGGNTIIVLASESKPLSAVTFAEVLNSSDVPGGVVNILTGKKEEVFQHVVNHMDLNSIAYDGDNKSEIKELQLKAASNVKRIRIYNENWSLNEAQNPYFIKDFSEVKTTWHPIEKIGPSGSGY